MVQLVTYVQTFPFMGRNMVSREEFDVITIFGAKTYNFSGN